MEITNGHDIYFKGCDVREANKESNYDDKTTKARSEFEKKKWIALDNLKEMLKNWDCHNNYDIRITLNTIMLRLENITKDESEDSTTYETSGGYPKKVK